MMSISLEKKLTEAISEGSEHAFDHLFNLYWSDLYTYAMGILKDHEVVSDVIQDVFLSVWEKRNGLNQIDSLRAYLYTMVKYQALVAIRRTKYGNSLRESLIQYLNKTDFSPEDQYIDKETLLLANEEIGNLPPKMRKIFELSRDEGLSYKEISVRLGVSENTIKKQISNSLRILRVKLNKDLGMLILILLNWL